ncbi:unnamed protein product [Prorocentrum cordatum]|uniref:Cytochrome b5 heme-binding domain-containing protein n=1 Tax=Prorocentrum cordatum TaxID=2364126 RepID=A0ABN9V2V2_9DINO|nr:unnamed protein product [Polarella glacialis]
MLPEHVAAQNLLELHQLWASGQAAAPAPRPREAASLEGPVDVSLEELARLRGADGGRVALGFGGRVFDVSTARELFGPCGRYAALAGRDVTRCLGEMCLDAEWLGDVGSEEERQLAEWNGLLMARYPVTGSLGIQCKRTASLASDAPLEQGIPARVVTPPFATSAEEDARPVLLSAASASQTKKHAATQADSGFMAGKSLISVVEKQRRQKALRGGLSDSLMARMCPLHADDATKKLVAVKAAISCISGAVSLHRQLNALP